MDKSVKMNCLTTFVGDKAKEAIAGMGYSGQMYDSAWSTVEPQFGQAEIVVKSQLKQNHSLPYIKPQDSPTFIEYFHLVTSCVNVLTMYQFHDD